VKLTRSEHKGVVVAIQIEGPGAELVKYLVGYYLNGEYKTVWLLDYEFSTEEDPCKQEIGFKQKEQI
jgi:hypothetical protein